VILGDETTTMASRLRYSGWFVADVPATVAFYQKAFGLRLRYMHPSLGYAELEAKNTLVAFIGEGFVSDLRLLGDLRYRPDRDAADAAAAQPALGTDDPESDGQLPASVDAEA
jgi:catechol 2,3-dioxygenase-like lactoylglutathione lyase family enzyme